MTYLVNRARQAVGLIRAVAWLGGWWYCLIPNYSKPDANTKTHDEKTTPVLPTPTCTCTQALPKNSLTSSTSIDPSTQAAIYLSSTTRTWSNDEISKTVSSLNKKTPVLPAYLAEIGSRPRNSSSRNRLTTNLPKCLPTLRAQHAPVCPDTQCPRLPMSCRDKDPHETTLCRRPCERIEQGNRSSAGLNSPAPRDQGRAWEVQRSSFGMPTWRLS